MRKRRCWVFAVAVMLLASTCLANEHRFAVFAYGGYAFPEQNKTRGGFEPGGGVSFSLIRHFALSFEFSSWQNRSLRSLMRPAYGTITISPIFFSLVYEFPPNEFCVPYVFGGAGFAFAKSKGLSSTALPEAKLSEDVRSGLGLYLGAGARISLSDSLCFLTEASYFRRSAPTRLVSRDIVFGETTDDTHVSLRTVLLRIGFKFLI
jgi:hypothetical protein